jgi:heme oxygenase
MPDNGRTEFGGVVISLRSRLKQETRMAHERVEQAFDLSSATGQVETYIVALTMMHGAYCGLRRELGRLSDNAMVEAEGEAATRVDRLRKDLRAFGVVAAPLPATPFTLEDSDEALGCEYVMRGSALGGLVILKRAIANLNVTEQQGGQFFYGDGQATKAIWSAFTDRLSHRAAQGPEADRIVRGAIKTFELFEGALSIPSPASPPTTCSRSTSMNMT